MSWDYDYYFVDGPGNTASGEQVMANFLQARTQIAGLQTDAAAQGYSTGLIAARPAASLATAGRRYYESTDEAGGHRLYLDIGTAWLQVAMSAAPLGYTTGNLSGTTDGTGAISWTFAHGLGSVPSQVVPIPRGVVPYTFGVPTYDGTNATIVGNNGAGFAGISCGWMAFK